MSNFSLVRGITRVGGGYLYDAAASRGTTVTSNVNTKGSYVEVVSALPFDVVGVTLWVEPYGTYLTASIDLATGAGGSEVVRVPDITVAPINNGPTLRPRPIEIPIALRKGQRLAIRIAGTNGFNNSTMRVTVELEGANWLAPVGLAHCTRLSTVLTIDAGGSAHTLSGWSQVVSSLAYRARALMIWAGNYGDSGGDSIWSVGVGAGGSEVTITRGHLTHGSFSDWATHNVVRCDIPEGQRIAAQHQSSATASSSPRNMNLTVHAFG